MRINDVAKSARVAQEKGERKEEKAAKIRAIQRRYISGSDLWPFFSRFLSLSGEREEEKNPSAQPRATRRRRASSRTRSNGVRNAIETIVAI